MSERPGWIRRIDPSRAFWMTFVLAAGVYLLCLGQYYVGFFIDDAAYVLGAQSLLEGRYVRLSTPELAPLTQFPPGYPLFLALFVKLAEPRWSLLLWTSLVLSLGSILLLRKSLPGTSPWTRWLIITLFALHSISVVLSGSLFSEALYLCLSLLIFLLLERCLTVNVRGWEPWVLGALVGYTAIVRTTGLLFVPIVGFTLLRAKRWGVLGRTLPFSLLPPVVFALVTHNTRNVHLALQKSMWDGLAETGWIGWMQHLLYTLNLFFVKGVFQLDLPFSVTGHVVSALLSLAFAALAIAGFLSLLRSRQVNRFLLGAMGAYLLGYLGIHSLWLALSPRFFYPVLPFLLYLGIEGARPLCAAFNTPRMMVRLLLGSLVIVYGYQLHDQINRRMQEEVGVKNPFPARTYAWIREHLPPEAVLIDPKTPVSFLYTGRKCLSYISAKDVENFRFQVLQMGLTHVLYLPYRPVVVRGVHPPTGANLQWVVGWPEAFPMIHQEPSEHTAIYQVAADPAFQTAYTAYLSAHAHLMKSQFAEASRELDRALRLYPALASAHNAYAALLILNGRQPARAEKHLRQALTIRPAYPSALLNLARLYSGQGKKELAIKTYQDALRAIPISGEAPVLKSQIESEIRGLRG